MLEIKRVRSLIARKAKGAAKESDGEEVGSSVRCTESRQAMKSLCRLQVLLVAGKN